MKQLPQYFLLILNLSAVSDRPKVTKRECQKVAETLGFEFRKQKGGSHKHFKKKGVGKVTIPQYRNDDFDDELFKSILRQMKITEAKFFEILDK